MTMALHVEFRKAEAAARNVSSDPKVIADICGLIARAVIDEREACAAIADNYAIGDRDRSASVQTSTATDIAVAIRNRT